VIQKSLALVNYPSMDADGIMCPGGSMSNMYGMVLARYKKAPEVKEKGVNHLPPLVCFTSEGGHYSITKAAHWLGLGTDNVYKVFPKIVTNIYLILLSGMRIYKAQ